MKCSLPLSRQERQQDVPHDNCRKTACFQNNQEGKADNQKDETCFIVPPRKALELQGEHRNFRHQ